MQDQSASPGGSENEWLRPGNLMRTCFRFPMIRRSLKGRVARHPLDETVWSSLSGRHAEFAVIRGGARRYESGFGVFAALREPTDETLLDLGALVGEFGDVALLQADPPVEVPGTIIVSQDVGVQMIGSRPGTEISLCADIVALSEADAREMLALATLTAPGPFFEQSHRLGNFVGVRAEGRLIAMGGERMKPAGHTEISGVCTHPKHRGRGLAANIMRHVCQRVLDRGETPFLHAYASNQDAISLYERLGFTHRREVLMTRFSRIEALGTGRVMGLRHQVYAND